MGNAFAGIRSGPKKIAVSFIQTKRPWELPTARRKSDCQAGCGLQGGPMAVTFRVWTLVSGFLISACVVPVLSADNPKRVKVFLFAGQSNMVGADAHPDRINQFPGFEGAGTPQEDVLFVRLPDAGQSEPAAWGRLEPSDSFGPEITFARSFKARDSSPLAIIKSAVGGTTVAFDWNPDAPDPGQKLYPRTLRLVRDSLKELDRRGLRYELAGVMWHQGENDMLDRKLNTQYAEGLTRLIARMRQDLNAPALKWFMGEVSEKGIWGMDNRSNLSILRQQQDRVLRLDPLLRWVPTSRLAFEVMDSGQPHYHFGTQGQLQLGQVFAGVYFEDLGLPSMIPDRGYQGSLPLAPGARVRLFVLAGQRNMEGEDSFASRISQVAGFESLDAAQNDVIFRYSLGGGVRVSRGWEPLGPVDDLGNFGPELSLGARLRKAVGGREGIAIVKFTHSGAQSPDWRPGGTLESHRNLYSKFITFIRDASDDLSRHGYDCSLEGVFWHTGENDTYFGPYARNYAGWMKELMAQTRVDLQQPGLRWFISEQHPGSIWKNISEINASLRELARSDNRVVVISSADLPHERLHFGTRGTLLLGERLADAYLQRQ